MRRWAYKWLRWEPLYECTCGYQPPTHLHMLWHIISTEWAEDECFHEIT